MVWQDNLLGVIGVAFVYSLIPQIVEGWKKKKGLITYQTSILNLVGIAFLSMIYFSIQLYIASSVALTTSMLWAILLIQKIKYRNNE